MKIARVIVLFAAVFVGGCSHMGGGPGTLARDWSCKIREMQIRPVFPPREDVHVGDVFLLEKVADTDARGYCVDSPRRGDFLPIPIYIGYSAEVSKSANDHYKARPNFPRSSSSVGTVSFTATGGTVTFGVVPTDVTSASDSLFLTGKADRTRLVGFPDLLSVQIDRASIGAILPILGVISPIGLSAEEVDSASISVPVAESYGVPATVAWAAFQKEQDLPTALCTVGDAVAKADVGLTQKAFSYSLVTEVYYARAIDVNIQGRSAAALGLARNRSGTTSSTVPTVTSTGVFTPIGSLPAQATTTAQSISAVVEGLKQVIAARASVPGVTLALESGVSNTITMRRIFDRPVAIGFRSIGLEVVKDQNSGCTVQVAPPPISPTPATGQVGDKFKQ